MDPVCGLTKVNLLFNRIGNRGAAVLEPALTVENTKMEEFLVDISIDLELFHRIFRRDAGKKKKGGKKKKKA
jgi:hypothetical protein